MRVLPVFAALCLAAVATAECNHEFCLNGGADSPDVPGATLYHTSYPVLYLENIEATVENDKIAKYRINARISFELEK